MGVGYAWSAEAWARDAATTLAFLAARTERIVLGSGIMQISARAPSMTAMTALSLHELSGGRFILGLGASGPQVVEGLHGVSYRAPLGRLRETVDIARMAFRGEKLRYAGRHNALPRPGGDGKAIRIELPAPRASPSSSPPWRRNRSNTPAPPPTAGSARRFLPTMRRRISPISGAAPKPLDAASTTSRCTSPAMSTSATTPNPSSPRANPPLPSTWGRWARPPSTSTRTPSPAPATPTTPTPSSACGSTARENKPPLASPTRWSRASAPWARPNRCASAYSDTGRRRRPPSPCASKAATTPPALSALSAFLTCCGASTTV